MFSKNKFRKIIVIFLLISIFSLGSVQKARADEFSSLSKLQQIIYLINQYYVEDVEVEKLVEDAIEGMIGELDPYSGYLDSSEYSEMQMEFEGEYGGIGIVITTRNDQLTIVSPFKGTPGDKAGLEAGDVITKINDRATSKLSQENAVKLMRGKAGTTINITVKKAESDEIVELEITRANIEIPYVRSEMKEGNIGYIALLQFAEKVGSKMEDEIKSLKEKGAEKIILDLRNNPGGILNEAVDVASLFIKKGTVVSVKERTGDTRVLKVNPKIETFNLPIAVLINGGSASGSEIVAAAVQDYNRGKLVGSQTFGKGTVQSVVPLEDGSAVRITTARYYTPAGNFIHEKGIKPDIEIKYNDEYEKDNQLQKAIQILNPDYKMDLKKISQNQSHQPVPWYEKPLGKWIEEKFFQKR